MKKSYYAIIPENVRYDEDLNASAKLLYGEITALCNEKGYCWASNSYFARLYNLNKVTVSRWIKDLIDKNYIISELIYKEGTKEIANRYIRICYDPIGKNTKGNSTLDLNNTSNNTEVPYVEIINHLNDVTSKKL